MIERDGILKLLPHAGAMCLLDAVLHWDVTGLRCLSRRYGNADNPMRRADGRLGTACGVEIAAQAMAVHGGLTATGASPPRPGYLVSLRDVALHGGALDAGLSELMIDVTRLMGDKGGATYRFSLARQGATVLSGRATVLFGAGK